jgi:hypothetical protein
MTFLVTATAVLSMTVWLYLVALRGGRRKDHVSPAPLEDGRTGR